MSVFIRFLLDNLPLVIITGLVVLGIIGLSVTLIVCALREKKKKRMISAHEREISAEKRD